MNYPHAMREQQVGGIQNAPSRETHVGSQMGRQGKLIDELTKAIQVLEGRLQPVLRATPPIGASGQAGQEKTTLVGHAAAISNQNDQLDNLVHSVSDILERLEL